jgi:hypothetical protein
MPYSLREYRKGWTVTLSGILYRLRVVGRDGQHFIILEYYERFDSMEKFKKNGQSWKELEGVGKVGIIPNWSTKGGLDSGQWTVGITNHLRG